MPNDNNSILSFHTLYQGEFVRVNDYRCRACHGGPAAEEYSVANDIVLMRHGAFSKHFGRRSVTADVNQAVFFSKGSTYRVSHPGDCGDRGTVFTLSKRVLDDIIRDFNPAIDEHPEHSFPFVVGPCDSTAFLLHRELVKYLEAAESAQVDAVQVEEMTLFLASRVLEAAFLRSGLRRTGRRSSTEEDHADKVEAVKTYLAAHLGERITLDSVARAVYASPFHLARLFQRRTGVPVHRYLTRLRLRTSMERLAAGENDITSLALELGFSSHSHFTDTFGREFGFAPSEVRSKQSAEFFAN